jgi:hypothetical protein
VVQAGRQHDLERSVFELAVLAWANSQSPMLLTLEGRFPRIRPAKAVLLRPQGQMMPRFRLTLVSLLAVSTVSPLPAQTAPQPNTQQLPSSGWTPTNGPPASAPAWNSAPSQFTQPPASSATSPFASAPAANYPASNPPPTGLSPPSYPSANVPAAGGIGTAAAVPAANAAPLTDVPPTAGAPNPAAFPPLTSETPPPAAGGKALTLDPFKLNMSLPAPVVSLTDFFGYRYSESSLDWIPGTAQEFGMFSINYDHYQPAGFTQGLGIGMSFNFLCGPVQSDMPPILYNFSGAYQVRAKLGPLAVDAAGSVMEATDFKGNAGQGLHYPAHGVGYLGVRPDLDLVFGVDYVDLGSIKILPVGGVIWKPNPAMRFEAVFPRPRAVFQLAQDYRLYVSGQLAGGSWSIERAFTFDDDLATYRDLRVCIGLEHNEKAGHWSAIEAGYLFNRRLEYSSGLGNGALPDAAIIRLVTRY